MIDKAKAVEILEEISLLLELKGENVFKVRAFSNGARVLEGQPGDLKTLIETGELEKLKGIGKGSISKILHDLYEKGESGDYEDLRKGFPESLFELFRIPGLGAKRIKVLYDELHIRSAGELEYACKENRLLALDGFGQKMQEKIIEGIRHLKKSAGQFLLSFAREEAEKLMNYLKKQKGILKIEIAGSLRRSKEIVKDIDVLVSARDPAAIHRAFGRYPEKESAVAEGETKSSLRLKSGIQCDLRTVTEKEFPYALYYFTGSKEHNVAVRTIAKKKSIKVNEYGLFKGARLIPCKDETEIFTTLGLNYVPPEARENTGEVEWVSEKKFPELVEEKDLRGVFHVHSNQSDGTAPLEAMIAEAEKMGLEYVGISEHSQSAKYAGGLDPERVKKQWKQIETLQKNFKIRIFRGIESDILPDGNLDYPEAILAGFDFVIGSIHSRFRMPEAEMTRRIQRAMRNEYLTFVGHPTGRLLLARVGYAVNMPELLATAKEEGVVMELNANPQRLDLDWRVLQDARKKGVLFSINPDAHSLEGLHDISYGVGIARKGWLEKKDVVNTMPVREMEKFLRKRKS